MTEAETKQGSPEALARQLADAVVESPEYKEFLACSEELSNDSAAMGLLKSLQEKQVELYSSGDESVFKELEALQDKIKNNSSVKKYSEAQEKIVALLKESNEVVSGVIGSDFAQKSGCCGGGGCGGGCCD
jgi:cell fate (sporulation/competence/biofilm development) regulator YlbF (YheA/YmcA/DUF963 family)